VFTVGAFARVSGVSAKVLRAYDSLGLFRPVWVDRGTGYRYYSAAQLPELRRVLALRELGMGLGEIQRLVAGGEDLAVALERRRSALEEERREIDRRLAALRIEVDVASAGAAGRTDVVVRGAPAVSVATLSLDLVDSGDVGEAFYELEAHVRDVGRRAHGPPGALIEADRATELFVPVRGSVEKTERVGSCRLPTTRVASALHRGDYATMAVTRAALERWVEATGFATPGRLRVLYLQFGAEPELGVPRGYVVEEAAQFVTELQIPEGDSAA
jgi:DNA-binding transcriptional MerR regulator